MNQTTIVTNVEIPDTKDGCEIEHNHQQHEVGFLILLKTTLKTHLANTHFVYFVLFTAFPLLSLMMFFESLLEKTFTESLGILASSFRFSPEYWMPSLQAMQDPSFEFYQRLVFISLIYIFPLHLFKFIVAFLTVNLTSNSYKNDRNWSIKRERLKGAFVTSLYALFLSTSFLLGFVWLVNGFYNFAEFLFFAIVAMPLFFIVAVILIPKYLEFSIILHLAFVISVLEQVQGIEAFSVASYFCRKGNNLKLGRNLMLVFVVWGLVVRIPCLVFDDGDLGIIGRSHLLWLGELIKWFVFIVYYYYCKSKVLAIRVDEEVGGKACSLDDSTHQ